MDSYLFISFLLVSAGVIIIPGPNVLLIIATSLTHGKARGLQTVAGTTTAMALQLFVAAVGTKWIVQYLADGFVILRWLGVIYLLFLGLQQIRQIFYPAPLPAISVSATFARGFLISLTNPKTIIFFSAFLPQFVSPAGEYSEQIMLLSVTFLLLAVILDSCYAIFSGSCRAWIESRNLSAVRNGVSGVLLISMSIWVALMRRG